MDWSATANSVSLSSKCQLLECNMQMSEIRKVGRQKAGEHLFNSPMGCLIWFSARVKTLISDPRGRKTETLSYRRTPGPHVYVRPLSALRRRAGKGPESAANQTRRQRRDGAGHKSNALYCGARGSEHITNQTNSVGRMAGGTNHADPISSATCPCGGEHGGGGGKQTLLTLNRQRDKDMRIRMSDWETSVQRL